MQEMDEIERSVRRAVRELLDAAGLQPGDIFVMGCSSSEIVGQRIGRGSSLEAAQAVYNGAAPVLAAAGVYLAAQCCEHLNRALVVERAALPRDAALASAVPQPHAGGSFAATAWQRFSHPVLVEHICAHAGMDIGGTLIGMHLRDVAVPVRLGIDRIGAATLLCARTRPKYIGGPRAVYQPEEDNRA